MVKLAEIRLEQASKQYSYQKVFQGVSHTMSAGGVYGIAGPNGSGKSTMLQCIIAYRRLSSGTISWIDEHSADIPSTQLNTYFSYSAPYAELIEEYTIPELMSILSERWSTYWNPDLYAQLLRDFGLETRLDLHISKLSSGQKQKVNLLQALAIQKDVLLLDEPTSFLDRGSIEVYRHHIANMSDRLIIIASNTDQDFPAGIDMIRL